MSERKSLQDLENETIEARRKWYYAIIKHVKSGDLYRIVDVHHRESDMALCVEYTPIGEYYDRVKFARSIEEMAFGERFVIELTGNPA